MSQIFSITSKDSKTVELNLILTQGDNILAPGYSNMLPIKIENDTLLFAYKKTTQKLDVFSLYDKEPWFKLKKADIDLGNHKWDILKTFVLGNIPHLLAYEIGGTIAIYQIRNDLSLSKPYTLKFTRGTTTDGFTTVEPFTSLGQQFFLCYNSKNGRVTNFKISVEVSSEGGRPPIRVSNVWWHKWDDSWNHFIFFTLGAANFFFKIKTDPKKLNANIDHIQDDPSRGGVEVDSHLDNQLTDPLSINIVKIVPWENDEPYFLTYIGKSGETAIHHIHANCQGWKKIGEMTSDKNASIIIPYRIKDKTFALFY